MTERRNLRTFLSWAISLVVHGLLLVLFLIMRVLVVPEVPEYSEMDFISLPSATSPAYSQVPSVSTPASEEPPVAGPDETPENLALPKMRHLPDEQPELIERKVEKIAPTEKPSGGLVEPVARPLEPREKYPLSPAEGRGTKPTPPAQRLLLGEKPRAGSGEVAEEFRTRPYSIEGVASARQIITEVLPEYPPGLNREAVIKISFAVLPNGTVGEMVPLLKGDSTLEEITLNAFRQWRFNPLSPDAPQVSQPGVITFRYILK